MATKQPSTDDETKDVIPFGEKDVLNSSSALGRSRMGNLDGEADSVQIMKWASGDPENPYNWSTARKLIITFIGILVTINSTLGSSLPANEISYIADTFGITDKNIEILPMSVYLIGYIFGPILFAPLSELYGRRWITIATFSLFTLSTMAAALAPNWTSLLIFRLLAGIGASAPISVVGGIYADIYESPIARGRSVAVFFTTIGFGPLMSPIIAGCSAPTIGWRWSFWIALIIAGGSFVGLIFLPETYGPKLLGDRAKKLRKSGTNTCVYGPLEINSRGWRDLLHPRTLLPLRMLFTEPIVTVVCLYLAILYGMFYMYFGAYPIIFEGVYKMSACKSGAMFLPMGAGDLVAIALGALYDNYNERTRVSEPPSHRAEELFRLPPACVGGPITVLSIFWLGWTARTEVPWAVPFTSGIVYGIGSQLIFIGLLNYLADAYTIYAASAFAASSCSRSIFGALLPLAVTKMYDALGVAWATSTLGFSVVVMSMVPFALIRYGPYLRSRSSLCSQLRKDREERESES
ncbi:related to fluconazole resistance protein (FLU1) [Rhynchosporium secalis]|uniref:Related to fluconazole resistance protein (FLU1) n=1 Tax=Rhynchosporium secalis TaxID=38038 RepID=A0A1E1MUZ5_RHYSE|nr:related to fluconazole resistance protein (FLU1) [Rhynchosporium secalis]